MSVKLSVISNYFGQGWLALSGLILAPFYIRYIGADGYGLIGFFLTIYATILFIDMGLSATATKEVSKKLGNDFQYDHLLRIFSTFGIIFVGIGVAASMLFLLSADLIANKIITSDILTQKVVINSVYVFSLVILVRWPVALIQAVLRGAQKDVIINSISITVNVFKVFTTIYALAIYNINVDTALLIILATHLLEFSILILSILHLVKWNISGKIVFDLHLIKTNWKFSSNVALTSIFAIILKQTDKLLIGVLLPINYLGIYMLASQAVRVISLLVNPLSITSFPKFSELFAREQYKKLNKLFIKFVALSAFIVTPVAALLIYYPNEVLYLWVRDYNVAANAGVALSILALANLFNSPLQILYTLSMSSGTNHIQLMFNSIGVLFLFPLSYFLISNYEIQGAAWSWLVFNLVYFIVVPFLMHKRVRSIFDFKKFLETTLGFSFIGFMAFWTTGVVFSGLDFWIVTLFALIIYLFIVSCIKVQFLSPVVEIVNVIWKKK